MFSIITQILISLTIIIISGLAYLYSGVIRARKICNWLPHAPRIPFLGSVLEMRQPTEILNDFMRLTNNPEKMVYAEFVYEWNIISKNYDFLEFILSSSSSAVLDKSRDYEHFHSWLGTGLLTSSGSKWRKRRKIITPAFHFSILEQFVDVFESNANILIKKLEKEATDKPKVDIYDYITACALDSICETAMGVNIESQSNKNQDYVFSVRDICRIITTRPLSTWKESDLLFKLFSQDYKKYENHLKILHELTNSVIEKRRQELKNKKFNKNLEEDGSGRKRKLAFLDLLLNSTIDGQPLSQEDIREEVDTFMFEGHDTTASAIAAALFLLANHPEVQKSVREEQKVIFGTDRDRTVTHQDLQDMKYLDLVIKETLRLYPSVPFIGRQITEDINYKGHVIPKGTLVTLFIYGILRDPDYFEDPEKFKPERFLNSTGKQPYSYIPFSAGPRNCIGQKFAILEMKSMISAIIKNFELYPADPPHEPLLSSEAVLKSLNGVIIRLKKHKWE